MDVLGAILNFIRRQVGLRDDAASATASLHAKVKDVKNYLTAMVKGTDFAAKLPRFATSTATIAHGSSATISTVTAAGFLTGLEIFLYQATSGDSISTRLTITIDGTDRLDTTAANFTLFAGIATYQKAWAAITIPMMHRFATSYTIKIYNNHVADDIDVKAQTSYLLD